MTHTRLFFFLRERKWNGGKKDEEPHSALKEKMVNCINGWKEVKLLTEWRKMEQLNGRGGDEWIKGIGSKRLMKGGREQKGRE